VQVVKIEVLVRGSISMNEGNPICHEAGMELSGSVVTIDRRKGGASPSATDELDFLRASLESHEPTMNVGGQ